MGTITRIGICIALVSGIAGVLCDYRLFKEYRAVFAVRNIPFGKVISADDVAVFTFYDSSVEMVGFQSNVERVIGQVAEREIQMGQEIIKLKRQKGMTGAFFSHGALKRNIWYLKQNNSGKVQNTIRFVNLHLRQFDIDNQGF